jgi:ubiquinone/menaquinone biosynthesis C-methylase UbiE
LIASTAGPRRPPTVQRPSDDEIRNKAIAAYYWKPMAAIFRTLELDAFARAGLHLGPPILDLGCGDGLQARLLTELGLIDRPLCGLDILERSARAAVPVAGHRGVLIADATRVPLASGAFQTIISSTLFTSVGSPSSALHESRRLLKSGGVLTAICVTDAFDDLLPVRRALSRVSKPLGDEYTRRVRARFLSYNCWPVQEWVTTIESAGFSVVHVHPFFGAPAARLWSLWSPQVLRVLTCLRFVPRRLSHAAMSPLMNSSLRRVHEEDQAAGPHGLVFIAAVAV